MISVLVADDHAVVRSGIRQIFATTTDLAVAGEAGNGQEVLARIRSGEWHLLLMDMTMPGLSGVDLIRRVKAERPTLPVLVLSMHNEGQVVSRALRAGASGYLTKGCEPEILLAAIRKVAAGGNFIDPALVETVVFSGRSPESLPHEVLSDREFQVLQQVAAGRSLAEIGMAFSISAKTVSTHKTRLMEKLGIENNAELVRYAIRHGLLQE